MDQGAPHPTRRGRSAPTPGKRVDPKITMGDNSDNLFGSYMICYGRRMESNMFDSSLQTIDCLQGHIHN